ncbi:MAG: family 16 glycoside hydrolase, partial [Verrucomicrobiota bacterium]
REAFKKDKTPMPRLKRPEVPTDPHLKPNAPAAIYNYKIAPATPYAIAGAIWYQGESNSSRAAQYEHIFPAMIEDWRAQWGYDFPFYFVQLANFRTPSEAPGTPSSWAELQNAQRITLQKTPNTGMAIINDIGEAKDIHPGNKQDVGKRLSRLALGEHYQSGLTPTSGPLYRSHEIKDGSITVTFDHVGTGLKKRDTQAALGRFEIAGDDQVWKWADASINQDGKTVTVSSKEVAAPVAVRYAWADNPEGANLVNSAGTPASLFRTDDWELSTQGLNFPGSKSFAKLKAEAINRNTKLEKQGWEVLFNGYDLTGWTNPYQHGKVSVDNGEIHLEADKKFFLVTEKTYSDFTLRVDIKLPEGKANSGVMFRANVQPGKVFGYQAECDGSDRRWSGGLYDEGRRGWIWPSTPGKSKEEFLSHSEESLAHMAEPKVQNALKRNDWNTYMIRCLGDNISITVNGVRVTQIKDSTDAEGVIGIQHHGEKGAVYKFRNLYLKPL